MGDAAHSVSSFGAAPYPFKKGLAGPYFEWGAALGRVDGFNKDEGAGESYD